MPADSNGFPQGSGSEIGRPRLLQRVHEAIRVRHYSRRTEEAYVHWIKRLIYFHGKRHPDTMGEAEVTAFLNHLAVERHVAAARRIRRSPQSCSSTGRYGVRVAMAGWRAATFTATPRSDGAYARRGRASSRRNDGNTVADREPPLRGRSAGNGVLAATGEGPGCSTALPRIWDSEFGIHGYPPSRPSPARGEGACLHPTAPSHVARLSPEGAVFSTSVCFRVTPWPICS